MADIAFGLGAFQEEIVVSAATCNIGAATKAKVRITGSTGPITSFGSVADKIRFVRFTGTPTLTHSAALSLPTLANIAVEADDTCLAISGSTGDWIVYNYQRKSGIPLAADALKLNTTGDITHTSGSATATLASTGWIFALPTGAAAFTIRGDTGATLAVQRSAAAASSAPIIRFDRYRGAIGAQTAVALSDVLGEYGWFGYDGSNLRRAASFLITTIANPPSSTDMAGRFQIDLSAVASVSPSAIFRMDHATGLSYGSGNVFLDQNRHFRLRSYTIGTLPAAAVAAGQVIYCSDMGGGGGVLYSDGTVWRRVSPDGQQTVATDAIFTLTPLTSAGEQKHTGTLTANRAVTLSTTNAYAGARFRITRTGGGAFTLDVGTGPLKSLATGTWAEFIYDGAAWYLATPP